MVLVCQNRYGCNSNPNAFKYVEPVGNIFVDPNTNDGSCFNVISGCKDDNTAFVSIFHCSIDQKIYRIKIIPRENLVGFVTVVLYQVIFPI